MWEFLAGLPAGALYITFAFIAIVELYFFLIQRSALEIARLGALDARTSRYLLPLWFIFHWPIQIVKWLTLLLIFLAVGWIPAAVCLGTSFLVSQVVPIPHRHFIPIFRRRIARDLVTGENLDVAANLREVLELAAKRLELDERGSPN